MQMIYEKVIAVRKTSKPMISEEDGRYFILFACDDGKIYQVKFNLTTTKGNQNELITHYIGSRVGAPVLEGRLVTFSKRALETIAKEMAARTRGHVDSTFYRSTELFGIEWHEAARMASSEAEVFTFFSMCKNFNSFYAIYPFDQYLRNYDRQYFNHLMVKKEQDRKPTHYYATIDGDRLFGSTGWQGIDIERGEFGCFEEDFHPILYGIVSEKGYETVYKYAIEVESISNSDIDGLYEILCNIYNDPKSEHDKIAEVLKYRRSRVRAACDGSCFPKVKKQRLPDYEPRPEPPTV